jgi:hypothetical protein
MKSRAVVGLILVVGLGLGSVCLHQLRQRPGGFEEVVGNALSQLRRTAPALVDPVTRVEDRLHESWYHLSLRWRGRTAASVSASTRATTASADIPGPPGSNPLTWTPVSAGTSNWLAESMLVTNPDFPEAPSLLLRVSLKRARLCWQPGTRNPWRMTPQHRLLADASPPPDRTGRVPADALADTLLAFGGGFESIHFYNYGAIWRGREIVPLEAGIQTLAIYDDGSVRLAPWGSPDLPVAGIREARQNLPPLVHRGKIPAGITWLNAGTQGARYTSDSHGHRLYADVHTWRSGLGLTAEGDLVYCFGSRLTPRMLAEALLRAGAVEAMMLDINAAYHCTPSLIEPSGASRAQVRGLYPRVNAGQRFVTGSPKDFFYVRPGGLHEPRVS